MVDSVERLDKETTASIETSGFDDGTEGKALRHRRGFHEEQTPVESNKMPSASSLPTIEQPAPFMPAAILDGSKLILRLACHDQFILDSPCKILLSTPNFKFERLLAWQTLATATEQENTAIIDTNLLGHRFIPIPLSHYGTVYTKSGTVHVVVGNLVKRAKVYSGNLPYRACNKFHSLAILESETEEETGASTVTAWFLERQSTSKALSSIDPDKAVKMIKQLAANPQQGIVYIRADDSMMRYTLKHDDCINLVSGKVIAWTVGIRFEMTSYCCMRSISAIHGEGTVWIQNTRSARPFPSGNGTV